MIIMILVLPPLLIIPPPSIIFSTLTGAWKGKKMVKVDRFFSSGKKCCKCGRIKKELKLSERVYRCACGNEMDRDRNAAINIREEARRMLTA